MFLYRDVFGENMNWIELSVRAKRPERLPVVLTRDEVRSLIGRMSGVAKLVASLLYGSELRLMESLELRVKDLDLVQGDSCSRRQRTQGPANNASSRNEAAAGGTSTVRSRSSSTGS